MTWAFYLLMRNPQAQQGVLAELKKWSFEMNKALPLSFDAVQSTCLPYTTAVFNETLRLYPPVPVELKECTADTTFPDATWLPKGSVVLWSPWSMGRSKHIWGEDADHFKPERWLIQDADGRTCLTAKTAFEFPVFNGGPRSCLGKKLAEVLAVYIIASFVWRYDFQAVDENPQHCRLSQNSLTLPMQGGLPCRITRRCGVKN